MPRLQIANCRLQICATVLAGAALYVASLYVGPSFSSGAAVILHAQVDTKPATAAIMKLDADFNKSVADRDRTKFLSFLADTAVFVGAAENRGRDAIMKAWSPFFEDDGPRLAWKPTHAEVLVGGDLGYTVGTWTSRTKGPDGKPSEAHGQYLTTWRKQKDGSWKIVYDIGSTAP
jgi:uncharacterized protein (TIGR02246 family)